MPLQVDAHMCTAALPRWTTFVVACAVASFAYAQSTSGSQDSEAGYKVAGSVVNSVTGEPVRRAVVELRAGSERLAFTDSNGQFEFDNLRSGQAALRVRKPGFMEEREAGQGAGPQTAKIGPEAAPVVLKLVPESVIYGRAQDAAGDPIEHLPVKVIAARIYNGRKHWMQRQMTMTNDDGDFRLANLPPGSYYLQAGPTWDFGNPHGDGHDQAYAAVYYPAAADPSGASLIEVSAGQQVNTNLILSPIALFKISGQILGGFAEQGVNLQFFDSFGNSIAFPVVEQPGGRFEAKAPAGSYTLEVNAWGGRGNELVAGVSLNTTSDMAGLRLVLAPPTSIPIIVRGEATHPSAASFGKGGLPVPSVHLSQAGVSIGGREFWDSSLPESSSHALANVSPGTYSVEVNSNREGSWYVQSVESGGVDLLRENLSVASGVTAPPIEIVMRDDAASLRGQVSGESNGRAIVVAVPDGAPLRASSAPLGTDGEFFLPNLAPGSYSVLAFDRTDIEYTNPDVLGRFMAQASHVDLHANDEHTVNLELIHGNE